MDSGWWWWWWGGKKKRSLTILKMDVKYMSLIIPHTQTQIHSFICIALINTSIILHSSHSMADDINQHNIENLEEIERKLVAQIKEVGVKCNSMGSQM